MKKRSWILVLVILALLMSACGGQKNAEESAVGLPNPWSEAADAEEAAQGAGLDSFMVPEALFCFPNGFEGPAFQYTKGLAQAQYQDGQNRLVLRKGLGEEDISGDYTAYPETWEINWKGLSIQCSGAEGKVGLARWSVDGCSFSLGWYALEGESTGLSEEEVCSLVNQVQ